MPRKLVSDAVKDALDTCSNYSKHGKKQLKDLVLLCLNNFVVEFNGSYYTREKGLITGENNSVSLANIGLHYVMQNIDILKQTKIIKRYIDDIIYVTKDDDNKEIIKDELIKNFEKQELKLTFREISTKDENAQVEFLDVLHQIKTTATKGFITKDFIKPTAKNATFLHGKSYHPKYMFKGIVISEAHRLRRLNEEDKDYIESIERLKNKCKRSNFDESTLNEAIEEVKKWHQRTNEEITTNKLGKNDKREKNTWVTMFKSLLKLTEQEKQLSPNTCVTYKRPKTIQGWLTNYKKISRTNGTEKEKGYSSRCGKCSLCGGLRNFKNMVKETDRTTTKEGKVILIKQGLNCKNYGIYQAECLFCAQKYIGQTKTSFTKRWTQHRNKWKNLTNNPETKTDIWNQDEQALYKHYNTFHQDINKTTNIDEAYQVTFLQEPRYGALDLEESFWISRTNAEINISKTFLPKIK